MHRLPCLLALLCLVLAPFAAAEVISDQPAREVWLSVDGVEIDSERLSSTENVETIAVESRHYQDTGYAYRHPDFPTVAIVVLHASEGAPVVRIEIPIITSEGGVTVSFDTTGDRPLNTSLAESLGFTVSSTQEKALVSTTLEREGLSGNWWTGDGQLRTEFRASDQLTAEDLEDIGTLLVDARIDQNDWENNRTIKEHQGESRAAEDRRTFAWGEAMAAAFADLQARGVLTGLSDEDARAAAEAVGVDTNDRFVRVRPAEGGWQQEIIVTESGGSPGFVNGSSLPPAPPAATSDDTIDEPGGSTNDDATRDPEPKGNDASDDGSAVGSPGVGVGLLLGAIGLSALALRRR